jgi:hypothetical protein
MLQQGLLARTRDAGRNGAGHTPVTGLRREAQGFAIETTRGRIQADANRGHHQRLHGPDDTGARTPCRRDTELSHRDEQLGRDRVEQLIPNAA